MEACNEFLGAVLKAMVVVVAKVLPIMLGLPPPLEQDFVSEH